MITPILVADAPMLTDYPQERGDHCTDQVDPFISLVILKPPIKRIDQVDRQQTRNPIVIGMKKPDDGAGNN